MLCVSISDRNIAESLRQMKGAEMVELRADLAGFSTAEVSEVVGQHPNVMLTWHTTPESEPEAERAVEAALAAGARWVDVEIHASEGYRERIIDKAHSVGAKVIISYHNYSATPLLEELIATTERCFSLGADIAKVITTAHTTAEGATIATLYNHFQPDRLIAFAMGAEGIFTRRLSLLLGAPWTYVAPSAYLATAPGQFTAEALRAILSGGTPLVLPALPTQVNLPATKSAAQRAIVGAMLAEGVSQLEGFAACGDSLGALRVAEALGCKVEQQGDTLRIVSGGAQQIRQILNRQNVTIDTTESGLLTRLLLPLVAALTDNCEVHITGHGTLPQRSLTESVGALRSVGAEVRGSGDDGCHIPMVVRGPIRERNITIDGSRSSQVASGLMMALPLLPAGTSLTIDNPTSLPYLHLTEQVMAAFGCGLTRCEVPNGLQYTLTTQAHYTPTSLHLEADWSSAGYFAAAYALAQSGEAGGKWCCGEYRLEGMSRATAQADEIIIDILKGCGANIVESEGTIRFLPSAVLTPMEVDASNFPDLVPTLSVVALFTNGISRIGGLHRLGAKESNRTEALFSELKALGARIAIEGDSFTIEGTHSGEGYCLHAPLGGAPLRSYDDHRMVMSLSIVSLFMGDLLAIDSTSAVGKSFPTFFDKFNTKS